MKRAIELAHNKSNKSCFVIVSLVSAFRDVKEEAKKIIGPQNLIEVQANTPLRKMIRRACIKELEKD